MQRVRMQWQNREIEVIVEKIQGRLWFHLDGETHVYDPNLGVQKSKTGNASANVILAPMPGKILRVDAKTGDKVSVGQVLVVMEAMKMEYTLASAIVSTVEEVGCQAGAQVKLGQMLVRLK